MSANQANFLFENITRRAKLVSMVKLALLFVALLLLVAVLYISFRQSSDNRFNLVFSSIESGDDSLPTMINPRFHGMDKDNNPYNVTATKAVQQDDETVLMDEVAADLTLKDKSWLSVLSPHGILKLEEKNLYFYGGVELFHDQGYDMQTESVVVDMVKSVAAGDKAVTMKGPLGTLEAQRFSLDNKGRYMRFDGNVRMVLFPRKRYEG